MVPASLIARPDIELDSCEDLSGKLGRHVCTIILDEPLGEIAWTRRPNKGTLNEMIFSHRPFPF